MHRVILDRPYNLPDNLSLGNNSDDELNKTRPLLNNGYLAALSDRLS
jgi:hypothetical protein